MKYQKISTKKLLFLATSISTMAFANANLFEPSTTPIFSTPQARPNIHMMLDDSGSMKEVDVMAPEHFFGFGQPACEPGLQDQAWHEERKQNNEYDPFQDGRYLPWDNSKANGGLINSQKNHRE